MYNNNVPSTRKLGGMVVHDVGMHAVDMQDVDMHDVGMHSVGMHCATVHGLDLPGTGVHKNWCFFSRKLLIFDGRLAV